MNKVLRLSNAIDNMNDRFVLEAFEYKKSTYRCKRVGVLAACLCFVIVIMFLTYRDNNLTLTVYAFGTNQIISNETVVMPGTIDDNGQMKGHPLQFYIMGENINSIRFSCENEMISFVDWTEQRGDFGLSKNLTVQYGENEEDYYYLVLDWIPQSVIRKLTDNQNVTIADLSAEEKVDKIVMQVTYQDGTEKVAVININLSDDGEFIVGVSDYEITDNDDFVFQEDALPIEHQP